MGKAVHGEEGRAIDSLSPSCSAIDLRVSIKSSFCNTRLGSSDYLVSARRMHVNSPCNRTVSSQDAARTWWCGLMHTTSEEHRTRGYHEPPRVVNQAPLYYSCTSKSAAPSRDPYSAAAPTITRHRNRASSLERAACRLNCSNTSISQRALLHSRY